MVRVLVNKEDSPTIDAMEGLEKTTLSQIPPVPLQDDDLSSGAKVLFGIIFSQLHGGGCNFNLQTLSKLSNLSTSTVKKHINTFLKKGYIVDEEEKRDGFQLGDGLETKIG